eukprot:6360528-Amphidinium_carterae.1
MTSVQVRNVFPRVQTQGSKALREGLMDLFSFLPYHGTRGPTPAWSKPKQQKRNGQEDRGQGSTEWMSCYPTPWLPHIYSKRNGFQQRD